MADTPANPPKPKISESEKLKHTLKMADFNNQYSAKLSSIGLNVHKSPPKSSGAQNF
jgi:hypothetical protein